MQFYSLNEKSTKNVKNYPFCSAQTCYNRHRENTASDKKENHHAAMENAQVFGIPQPQIFVSERTPEGAELTQMEYEFYPQALEHVIRKVAEEFKGDLIVTENGIATADDARRVAFIRQALDGVQHCIADGIPVKGYFHWSLMDNFEWQKGYAMQFGLIAVNRETMERTAKPSLAVLGEYCGA